MDASQSSLSRGRPSGEVELKIEVGRARIDREQASQLGAGSVVALDARTADPLDVVAGGRLVARGQMLVLEGKLGVRITELVAGDVRIGNAAA